jgi:hypothetical protein
MDTTALAGLNPFGIFDVEAARLVVKSSTEWPEAIDAGFAHLVQPGPPPANSDGG